MNIKEWQERVSELSDNLSDIAIEMADDEGLCEIGLESLLSRSIVATILGICEEGEDFRPRLLSLQKQIEYDIDIAMSMKDRKH